MARCLQCKSVTRNPKFCNSSCSATFFNKRAPKRKRPKPGKCQECRRLMPPVGASTRIFCSLGCSSRHRRKQSFLAIRQAKAKPAWMGASTVKAYLKHTRGARCKLCKLTHWRKKPILLILDHRNGNSDDWRLSNLRLLCSNCDATTPTYKGANVGNGRHYRRMRYANGESY